jgi:hypothetical protein
MAMFDIVCPPFLTVRIQGGSMGRDRAVLFNNGAMPGEGAGLGGPCLANWRLGWSRSQTPDAGAPVARKKRIRH